MAKAKQVGKKLLGQALVEGGAQLANSQLQGNGDIKIKSITIILMYHDRVKKATYEELEEELLNPKLIVLHRPIKIPRFNMIENVNDVAFNDFDLDNRNKTCCFYQHRKIMNYKITICFLICLEK